jgi:uncharacterized membrane protein YraQ (UPF0718 family)
MEKLSKGMNRPGFLFLAIIIALYGVTLLAKPEAAAAAVARATDLLLTVLPVLLLVFVFLLLSNIMIKPAWVRSRLGQESGLGGWLFAIIAGILSAGPVYAWYALLGEFRTKGMRTALMTVFLYNRAIKLPLLPLMIHYFGTAYSVTLCSYLVLFSILIGIAMEKLVGDASAKE